MNPSTPRRKINKSALSFKLKKGIIIILWLARHTFALSFGSRWTPTKVGALVLRRRLLAKVDVHTNQVGLRLKSFIGSGQSEVSGMPEFFVLFLLPSFIIFSCNNMNPADPGYSIQADITGIKDGTARMVKLDLNTNEQVFVDSSQIIDGKFYFEGKLNSPYLHTIILPGTLQKFHLFLDNQPIKIIGHKSNLEQVKVTGSREDSLFRSFPMDAIFDRDAGMQIMLNYPDYTFAAFAAYYQFQIHNIDDDTMAFIVNHFTEPVKKSQYYSHLSSLYQTIQRVAISRSAPLFSIPDQQGKIVHLTDYRGKYTLIDFWASWCAPCRAANPAWVQVYNDFKDQNFEIIGISVDKDQKRWLEAIRHDALTWPNLSNLQGWDVVSDNYGVKAIPQNFLLDPEGIIIDKNLEPARLKEKLNILFSD